MTCYNKVDCIGEMLDSVISQLWDNIELILVNDGSTDGTREIITEYEPKLLKRGYDIVIIDQENSGVCSAAKAGFERVTGKYVCIVDCDDELDPRYVSTLAGWLDEHSEYDIAACDGISYTGKGVYRQFKDFRPVEISDGDPYLVERWMLIDFSAAPWIYMVRTDYFKKCCIVENYYTKTKGSHEPSYIIPLLSYGGIIKYFPLPLYRFNMNDFSHSRQKYSHQIKKHWEEYAGLCKIAIEALPDEIVSIEKKENLLRTVSIANCFRAYYYSLGLLSGSIYPPSNNEILSDLANHNNRSIFAEFMETVNNLFEIDPPIKPERAINNEWLFFEMVRNCLVKPKYRIVGFGASGKLASKHLPLLRGTPLEPTELWDEYDNTDTVKKPEYESLTSNDIAIVFPSVKSDVSREIIGKLVKTNCAIITSNELYAFEGKYQLAFPELTRIGRPKV